MEKENEKNSQLQENELSDDDLGSVAGGWKFIADDGKEYDFGPAQTGDLAVFKFDEEHKVTLDMQGIRNGHSKQIHAYLQN